MRFINDDIIPDRSALGPRMRVLGAGLPRCATSSLQAALESPHLGYTPCMHMAHVAPHPERCELVLEAIHETDTQRRHKILHRLFDGYEATTDFPGFWFIDDLMDMYPDAPVILNRRSDGCQAWWASMESAINFYSTRCYYLLCLLVRIDRLHYRIHTVMRDRWPARYGCDMSPGIYDAHARFVARECAKRGRPLLVWETKDGWETLCQFLSDSRDDEEDDEYDGGHDAEEEVQEEGAEGAEGVEGAKGAKREDTRRRRRRRRLVPPDQAFPWVNDAATMKTVKRIVVARGVLSWVALLAGLFAAWRYVGTWLVGAAMAVMAR
ncbi:hypothetical protein E4U54_006065 [Claviceps lovelessii]|nr:hypothetical protein E4U54_006065 [Claviceps lovelessii]